MSTFDDLLRQLAYRLWESRGRPIGTPQRDWFDALSLVNAVTETRSNSSAAFFHCFTRKRDDDHALATLRLMLEIGILLTPELLSFYPKPEVTQCRLSLAFIQPHELFRHSQAFGPFAIQMVSYEKLVGTFGASPVWYIPSFIKKDTGADIFEHGNPASVGEIVLGKAFSPAQGGDTPSERD